MADIGIVDDQMTVQQYMNPPGSRRYTPEPRPRPDEIFVDGARFRVLKDGGRFEGIQAWGTGDSAFWGGYSKLLRTGDVITCLGWSLNFNSKKAMAPNFTAPGVPDNMRWCQFWPMQGLFTPWPMDGWLELIPEGED